MYSKSEVKKIPPSAKLYTYKTQDEFKTTFVK
jgi:hypothetical protein